MNGSAFSYQTGRPSPLGMCIKNGVIYGNYETSYSVMAVKYDGTIYTPEQGLKGEALLEEGVKDTYNFGPILIKDGQAQPGLVRNSQILSENCCGNGETWHLCASCHRHWQLRRSEPLGSC